MRIYSSPLVIMDEQKPRLAVGTGMPRWERFRICEVPQSSALLPHHGLADATTPNQVSAEAMLQDCCAVMAGRWELQRSIHHSILRNVSG
jgi:hypothetical protein